MPYQVFPIIGFYVALPAWLGLRRQILGAGLMMLFGSALPLILPPADHYYGQFNQILPFMLMSPLALFIIALGSALHIHDWWSARARQRTRAEEGRGRPTSGNTRAG